MICNFSIFKNLAAITAGDDSFEKMTAEEKYRFLGIPEGNGYLNNEIQKAIQGKIKQVFANVPSDRSLNSRNLIEMSDSLIYDTVISGNDNMDSMRLLDLIKDSAKQFSTPDDTVRWEEAIRFTRNYYALSTILSHGNVDILRNQHPRAVDTATAMKDLKEMGCDIEIENGHIILHSGLEAIVADIEKDIQWIGGINIIEIIFGYFKRIYNVQLQRYMFFFNPGGHPGAMKPQTPFGYLLNLAVKYPEKKDHTKNIKRFQTSCHKIMESSTRILKSLDVQSYYIFEHALLNAEIIIQYTQDTAVFDTATAIPQSNPDMEIQMLPFLFG